MTKRPPVVKSTGGRFASGGRRSACGRERRRTRSPEIPGEKGVGHLPYEEAPEQFNRALVDFLTGAPFSVPSSKFSEAGLTEN